jgi:hypothetical protein
MQLSGGNIARGEWSAIITINDDTGSIGLALENDRKRLYLRSSEQFLDSIQAISLYGGPVRRFPGQNYESDTQTAHGTIRIQLFIMDRCGSLVMQ